MLDSRSALLCSVLATTLAAQDTVPPADAFQTACDRMAQIPAVAFESVETQDDAMMRMLRGQIPGGLDNRETEVFGGAAGDVRWGSVDKDADEVVIRNGRSVARYDGGPWRPRSGTLENGTPAPFVVDPHHLFGMLARLPADARATATSTATEFRGAAARLWSLHVAGDAAADLVLGGALPSAGRAGGGPMILGLGGGGARPEQPTIEVDLAIWVDDATGNIVRVRAAAYQTSAMAGQVHFEIQGGGETFGEADEEVEEFDAAGSRRVVGGLPVRKPADGQSVATLDVRFSKHGEAQVPELDETARTHLGLAKR